MSSSWQCTQSDAWGKKRLCSQQCQNMPLSMKSNIVGLTKEKTQVYTSTKTNCYQRVALIGLVKLLATLCSSGSKNLYHGNIARFFCQLFRHSSPSYIHTDCHTVTVCPPCSFFSTVLLLYPTFRLCSQNKVKYHASRSAFVFMF